MNSRSRRAHLDRGRPEGAEASATVEQGQAEPQLDLRLVLHGRRRRHSSRSPDADRADLSFLWFFSFLLDHAAGYNGLQLPELLGDLGQAAITVQR